MKHQITSTLETENSFFWYLQRVHDILYGISGLNCFNEDAIWIYTVDDEGTKKLIPRGRFDIVGDYIIDHPFYLHPYSPLVISVRKS